MTKLEDRVPQYFEITFTFKSGNMETLRSWPRAEDLEHNTPFELMSKLIENAWNSPGGIFLNASPSAMITVDIKEVETINGFIKNTADLDGDIDA